MHDAWLALRIRTSEGLNLPAMRSRHSIVTILFADIVGSTERAAELGDNGWNELLEELHLRFGREVRRFGGQVVKRLGDGVLAVFPRPGQAIRCGWAIRETVRDLGLEVRSGIHSGEVERRAGELGGIAIHIASRITGQAAGGDVLVSNAVREMETGAGFTFEDRGKHALKGIPGEWRLYALRRLPAGRTLRTGRWLPEVKSRTIVMGLAALLAIVGVVALIRVLPVILDGAEGDLSLDGEAVAILPFRVAGAAPELRYLQEGMVDLLSAKLTGEGGPRAADPRTVLGAWHRRGSGDPLTDEAALDFARSVGVGGLILGEIVGTEDRFVITASLFDVDTRGRRSGGSVEGSARELASLVDRLTAELLVRGAGESQRLDLLTSTSLPALRAYLDGQVAYRQGRYEVAARLFESAVEIDSTFALAALSLRVAGGWDTGASARQIEMAERLAWRERDRLSVRDRALLIHFTGDSYPRPNSLRDELEAAQRVVDLAPDRAESWYWLGDAYYHYNFELRMEEALDLAADAFRRSLKLDPNFAAPMEHLIDTTARRGNANETNRLGEEYLARHGEADVAGFFRWRVAVTVRDSAALAELRGQFDALSIQSLWRILGYAQVDGVRLADAFGAARAMEIANLTPGERDLSFHRLHNFAMNTGRPSDGEEWLSRWADQRDARRQRLVNAAFWGGDTASARRAASEMSVELESPLPTEAEAREDRFRDLCTLEIWKQRAGGGPIDGRSIARLRAIDPEEMPITAVEGGLCADVLTAWMAVDREQPSAGRLVRKLDETLLAYPIVSSRMRIFLLELIRLHERLKRDEAALRVAQSRYYSWATGTYLLSSSLSAEAELAERLGYFDRASRTRRHLQILREISE